MSIDRLTALDQVLLGISRVWPQDICALALLDGNRLFTESGRFQIEEVRHAIQSRLHLVPRFRQVIYAPPRGLGNPVWVDARTFDITQHVRELALDPPVADTELLLAAEKLRRQGRDPTRPMWEMWFLTGLANRQVGWFVKIHHSIADGMATMATVAGFLDPQPDTPHTPAPAWAPAPWPSTRQLLTDNLRRGIKRLLGLFSVLARPWTTQRKLRAVWPSARELLAEEPGAETSLDRMVGPDRNLAVIRTSLDLIQKIAHTHHATANDVLLAITSGGLRALLSSRGERVEGSTVRIYVPVSLRRHLGGPQHGNEIAQMVVPLSLGTSKPGQRLQQIALETTSRKSRPRMNLGAMFGSRIARRLMMKAAVKQRVNVTSASIPGPKEPLYLIGARVLEVFPILPLVANEPLGVGAVSYAGSFNIGIVADRDAFPDLEIFVAGATEELQALAAKSSTGPRVLSGQK